MAAPVEDQAEGDPGHGGGDRRGSGGPAGGRGRNWILTINNPAGAPSEAIPDDERIRFAAWQLERGEQGTEHIQAFLQFKQPVRFGTLKLLFPTAHIEQARDPAKSREYCTKADTRVAGPWERGSFSSAGKRTDLDAAADELRAGSKALRAVASSSPSTFIKFNRGLAAFARLHDRPRCVDGATVAFVLWGDTGTGKSKAAYDARPGAYRKPMTDSWWDGYEGQRTVIFDDWSGKDNMTLAQALRVFDRYPMQVPVKGGYAELQAKEFWLTTNLEFDAWYASEGKDKAPSPMQLDALRRRLKWLYVRSAEEIKQEGVKMEAAQGGTRWRVILAATSQETPFLPMFGARINLDYSAKWEVLVVDEEQPEVSLVELASDSE